MPTFGSVSSCAALMIAGALQGQQPLLRPAPGGPLEAGPGSGELILADVDRDGRVDLVSKHLLERRIAVHRGRGDGSFEANHRSLTLPWEAGAIALADVDRDGFPDLAIATRNSTAEYVHIVAGTRSGFAEPSRTRGIRTSAATATWKPIVRIIDIDRDGDLDIVVGNGRRASVEILLGNGRGEFALEPAVRLATGDERHEFDLGDIDGDGDIDLVDAGGIESGARGYLRVYAGNGHGRFTLQRGQPVALPPAPRGTTLTDFDRDGDLDVLAGHPDSLASVLLNDGMGRFTPLYGSPFRLPGPAYSPVSSDMNGDGRPDLVVATVTSVTVLLGSATGLLPAPGSPYPAGPGAYRAVAGDINRDDLPDVVASSFEGSTVRVLLGNAAVTNR